MSKRTIESLEIIVRPWEYSNDSNLVLRSTVKINGLEYSVQKNVSPDDLLSNFEQIWKHTGEILLDEIKRYK